MEYQRDFGRGDVFATLTDHIDAMSSDIGLMEIMGPSPQSTFDALLSQAEKTTGLKGRQTFLAKAVFNNVSGKTNQGDLTTAADFMQSTRNVLSAALLGKAFLSALSDVGFQAITSKYNNLPRLKC